MRDGLRIALIAGGLDTGGAEKQLVLTARALSGAGARVEVFALSGGPLAACLESLGIPVVLVRRAFGPAGRLASLAPHVAHFQPHVIQATHSFANLHAGLLARALGAVGVGVLRSDLAHCTGANGAWTRWLFRAPEVVLANSTAARRELLQAGWKRRESVFRVPNAIDLSDFDRDRGSAAKESGRVVVAAVGRLVPIKRMDRFVRAMALAAPVNPALTAVIVGDGPERVRLESLADRLELSRARLRFAGARPDVPAILASAEIFVLCSDGEGFPNAVMEAMAAGLPVITTPAGDAPRLVEDGVTGYVVPFDREELLADRILGLAGDPWMRRRMGETGRRAIERGLGLDALASRLFEVYRVCAARRGRGEILRALSTRALA